MTSWILSTNPIARLFKKEAVVTIDNDGIRVVQAENETIIKWDQLDSPPNLSLSIDGGCLTFISQGKNHRYRMLGYFTPFKYAKRFFPFWANQNAERLQDFLSDAYIQCTSTFLRDSSIENIRTVVRNEIKRWKGWDKVEGLSELAHKTATQLTNIHHWSSADIEKIRQRYVNKQLAQYQTFFDSVESNPLTNRQRIACVTDNDNNLLLAGAGTGKTSVMIGKAGYLVNSGKASPKQILMLAYGRIAAQEMNERIKEKLGFDDVKASTFHSLGVKIISEVEGKAPSLSKLEDNPKVKAKWMHDEIEILMRDNNYRKALLDYFSSYYFVDKNPWEFKSQGAYLKYLNDNEVQTMNGEKVKSHGEVAVANWLFRKGIKYQYEAKYRFDVATEKYRQYEPDFYLPDYDIYIEYYGTDENGDTAPYINRERYHQGIEWKRKTHKQYGTGYVEVFYHQHKKRKLPQALEKELLARGVKLEPVSDNALLDNLEQLGQVTELAKLLGALVDMYKAACLDESGVDKIIKESVDPMQTTKALELLMPLYQRYAKYLNDNQVIDFNDMIGKALEYVQNRQFHSPWKFLLVDEFQDISEPRARLVKALRDNTVKSSLFCVGDDWQAIYRFSGADVRLTTEFSNYFGATSETTLDMTFRFNSSIGDVATRFVTQNPVQLKKDIKSLVQVDRPAVSIVRQGIEDSGISALDKALTAISNQVIASKTPSKNKVYLLARYWYQLPDLNLLRRIKHQYSSLDIELQSFHASKGKEAEYVVVMGLATGKHGFPSEKQTPPLVDALLPQGDKFEYAEERRLFYVALTRAKHRVYLLVDMMDASEFVTELIKAKYPVETNEFDVSLIQKEAEKITCHQCGSGVLRPKAGQYGKFMSCSLYPRCKHKETPCTKCGSPMAHDATNSYQVCIDVSCGDKRPLCQNCGSEMKLRQGKYGAFWGCSTYRKNYESNCSYKQNC
ncbi:UvrD-helicase domain-containing protein [Aliivibrio fischeri]|uniref:UvrD-helicase domain-containing protein n=1 Tax=Aliivibrio fischeri TaxID=668 RepID=UPI0012DA036A|nr:UvrD-helicase domain-containing protein [Aliivibrio fischeri]MUK70044.1 AAA family ATPase [Aliivibrio fischeri]MUK72578.1 AAA family ATPase [Aliivibrio fischeri]